MKMLELQNVYKDFKGLKVLNALDLEVEEGECHAIIGPNGAGKSTLFNVISGRYKPSRGKVIFKGENISGLPPYKIARKGLARSFQITNVFPEMTVYENLRNAVVSKAKLRFNHWLRIADIQCVADETAQLVERLGLTEIKDVPATELSYGKQRALEVGMTLATDPTLILLDEPTAGMSRDQTNEAVAFIKHVTQGKTLMIVEHDMDVVFSMADRITVLSYGEVLATGHPDDIRGNEQVRSAYLRKNKNAGP
jgi:branched-chain amino acid transport system ATP-binding protein